MATNNHGRKYTYKLAGTSILVLRIVLAALYLHTLITAPGIKFTDFVCLAHFLLCVGEMTYSIAFLFVPSLTCHGNGYLLCLPFLLFSVGASLTMLAIPFGFLEDTAAPGAHVAHRFPRICMNIIAALISYGGMASPLKLSWMDVFKPFACHKVSKSSKK